MPAPRWPVLFVDRKHNMCLQGKHWKMMRCSLYSLRQHLPFLSWKFPPGKLRKPDVSSRLYWTVPHHLSLMWLFTPDLYETGLNCAWLCLRNNSNIKPWPSWCRTCPSGTGIDSVYQTLKNQLNTQRSPSGVRQWKQKSYSERAIMDPPKKQKNKPLKYAIKRGIHRWEFW